MSVDKSGDRIVYDDAEIVHAQLQHAGRDEKAQRARDEIEEIGPLPVFYFPSPPHFFIADTNAPNIFRLFASVLYENSGCHWTAQRKCLAGA